MEKSNYYHLFANGDDAKNFITSESEFKAAFNRFAICAYLTGVAVLSFSVEDTHPHALLYGKYEDCFRFKSLYVSMSVRSIVQKRGSASGVNLHCELLEVTDESYLMNVACYTIVQATKDGKAVMPYDYRYGTGPLYFRSRYSVLPWMVDEDGEVSKPTKFGELSARRQAELCPSRCRIPDDWSVCNGFILPTNYVNVREFERIYKTPNCFRVFMSSNKSKDMEILSRMAEARGVIIEDLEARALCAKECFVLFGKKTTHSLGVPERLALAREMRKKYHLAFRQLSFLVHIPETELRKYI